MRLYGYDNINILKLYIKEQEKLGIDSACILNWYCSYERRKFAGKYINVDYVEHIPANEGPNAWW